MWRCYWVGNASGSILWQPNPLHKKYQIWSNNISSVRKSVEIRGANKNYLTAPNGPSALFTRVLIFHLAVPNPLLDIIVLMTSSLLRLAIWGKLPKNASRRGRKKFPRWGNSYLIYPIIYFPPPHTHTVLESLCNESSTARNGETTDDWISVFSSLSTSTYFLSNDKLLANES